MRGREKMIRELNKKQEKRRERKRRDKNRREETSRELRTDLCRNFIQFMTLFFLRC
jgi:hypothetical protein